MTPRRICLNCGTSLAGRSASRKTCSDACRAAVSRARRAGKPLPSELADKGGTARKVLEYNARAEAANAPATLPQGRLEATTRAKFDALGLDYESDPLAVLVLGMASTLDNPDSMAPGSIGTLSKAFRDGYREYLQGHNGGTDPADPVEQARQAAERARQEALAAR